MNCNSFELVVLILFLCVFFSLFKSTVSNFMPYYFILDVRLHLFSSIPLLVQNVFVFSLSCSLLFNFVCVFFFVLCNWCDLQSKRTQFTTAFKWYSQIAWIKKNRFQCTFDETKGFIAHMKKNEWYFAQPQWMLLD